MVNEAQSEEQLDGLMEVEGLITWFGDINGKLHMARLSEMPDQEAGEISE